MNCKKKKKKKTKSGFEELPERRETGEREKREKGSTVETDVCVLSVFSRLRLRVIFVTLN